MMGRTGNRTFVITKKMRWNYYMRVNGSERICCLIYPLLSIAEKGI